MITTDVLIIGSGIAGATAALTLAQDPTLRIIVMTREPDPNESNIFGTTPLMASASMANYQIIKIARL